MTAVVEPAYRSPDSDLATQVAKLWPHRECEANIILGQFCRIGLHWWQRLDLSELVPGKEIHFCFLCKKVKIDGCRPRTVTVFSPLLPLSVSEASIPIQRTGKSHLLPTRWRVRTADDFYSAECLEKTGFLETSPVGQTVIGQVTVNQTFKALSRTQ